MFTYEDWMNKGYLKKIWNCVHLQKEEGEDFEIRRCREWQLEKERRKLITWMDWQGKMKKENNILARERCENIDTLKINKKHY